MTTAEKVTRREELLIQIDTLQTECDQLTAEIKETLNGPTKRGRPAGSKNKPNGDHAE